MPPITYHQIRATVEEWAGRDWQGEGKLLPDMLQVAVPLWMHRLNEAGPDGREQELLRLQNETDFCQRLEYVLHKGPKKGDTARAFNDLAELIALLSFYPGGVKCFGVCWCWDNSAGKRV